MVAGLVLALTIMVTWPGLPRFGTHYLCDPTGDAYLGLWSMWHWNRAVESLQSPYWTDMLFHPTGMSLLYNCYSVVDMLLIAIPLTRIAGMTIAYN
ncbi:hypothetical protein H8D79_01845, partial [PVC group bacterium]|nr:hypothetical protein [PVC group bacterium]